MTKDELYLLKQYYEEELSKREEVLKLAKNPDVIKFLTLSDQEYIISEENMAFFSTRPEDIFKYILQLKRKMTLNGSTSIFVLDSSVSDNRGRKRKYFNLETCLANEPEVVRIDEEIDEFEATYDVIDSRNKSYMEDGYRKAQALLLTESFEHGIKAGRRKVLERYGSLRRINKEAHK